LDYQVSFDDYRKFFCTDHLVGADNRSFYKLSETVSHAHFDGHQTVIV